jgi:hypothetical protein
MDLGFEDTTVAVMINLGSKSRIDDLGRPAV